MAPQLICPDECPQPAEQQDDRSAEREKGSLRGTAGHCVGRRSATRAHPERGEDEEGYSCDGHHDAEPHGVTHAGIVTAQLVLSTAIHEYLNSPGEAGINLPDRYRLSGATSGGGFRRIRAKLPGCYPNVQSPGRSRQVALA